MLKRDNMRDEGRRIAIIYMIYSSRGNLYIMTWS